MDTSNDKKNILIVGLGIGQVYLEQCRERNFNVVTFDIDSSKNPDFTSLTELKNNSPNYDLTIIATPNFTHELYIRELASISNTILVEKPGLSSPDSWRSIMRDIFPTKLVMVKNNLYRSTLDQFKHWAKDSNSINICWVDTNRVPNAGGWSTNKKTAWRGISYDLMPHLLHFMIALGFDSLPQPIERKRIQKFQLSDIKTTEYGIINQNGIYDVDDHALLRYQLDGKIINLVAAWKNDEFKSDHKELQFIKSDIEYVDEFGLCPNDAYGQMIDDLLRMDEKSYQWHINIDMWVLGQIYYMDDTSFNLKDYMV